ncbi:MAG: hypothetical protein IJR90_04995 [Clostridia bacterium]|nr:hypothetical protein [Clostridia bacterium]
MISATGCVSNAEFARLSGCDRTYISRVRSGGRVLKRGGRGADTLIKALCAAAGKNSKTPELCLAAGAENDLEGADLYAAIEAALFDGEPEKDRRRSGRPHTDPESFGVRLSEVMELTGLTNARLARLANVDASLISRYRHGKRSPNVNRGAADSVCRSIIDRAESQKRLNELEALIGVPSGLFEDKESGFIAFRSWLCDAAVSQNGSIEQMLRDIDSISDAPLGFLPDPVLAAADAASDSRGEYYNVEGLKRAALRLLGTALLSGAERLTLYSDLAMNWMTADRGFSASWTSLMLACIKKGIRITVVHNIDRGLEEMTAGISKWMPLYMTGMVDGWYSVNPGGGRFTHTLFILPGRAAVTSCSAVGAAEQKYAFATGEADLKCAESSFDALFSGCKRLVKAGSDTDENAREITNLPFENIRVCIGGASVTVSRLSDPAFDLTVTHPLMRRAFASYDEFLNR